MTCSTRLAFVVPSPLILRFFLIFQINQLGKHFEVTLISNFSDKDFAEIRSLCPSAKLKSIPISRSINPFSDIVSLAKLYLFFKKKDFLIVHSISSKAGLLTMVIAWLLGVPVRVHTFTGQHWCTKTGFVRQFFKLMDRITSHYSNFTIVDSLSQREFLVNEKVISKTGSYVFGSGSISGVDLERFSVSAGIRAARRKAFGFLPSEFVIIFLGRLKIEKGVIELFKAFKILHKDFPSARLMLVGPDEDHVISKITAEPSDSIEWLTLIPYTHSPENYLAAADVLVLPSHREGFGTVVIEAASCGVPAVVSDIYGLRDTIVDGETGLLFEKGNVAELVTRLDKLASSKMLVKKLSESGLKRAKQEFSQEKVYKELINAYRLWVANSQR